MSRIDCIFHIAMNGFPCYNTLRKENSSGQGDCSSVEFPTGGIVRDPREAADLVRFRNRQYSLDERRKTWHVFVCAYVLPGDFFRDFFFVIKQMNFLSKIIFKGEKGT